MSPDRNRCRWLEEPTHCSNEEGHGGRAASGIWPCVSSRRRGDGTCGKSPGPKQGRSRRQPRPSRRARAPRITKRFLGSQGAPPRLADRVVVARTEGTTEPFPKDPWVEVVAVVGLRRAGYRRGPAGSAGGTLATQAMSNRGGSEGTRTWRLSSGVLRAGHG